MRDLYPYHSEGVLDEEVEKEGDEAESIIKRKSNSSISEQHYHSRNKLQAILFQFEGILLNTHSLNIFRLSIVSSRKRKKTFTEAVPGCVQ